MNAASLARWLTNGALCLAVTAFALFGLGPHSGQYRTLSILSDSMNPVFAAGDAIITTPISPRELREGDVISYHAPIEGKPLVTHRVTKLLRSGPRPIVQTKGDANTAIDPWAAELSTGTVWKQRATIPNAGHVTRALRHPAIKNLTVYALPLLLLAMMLTSIWRRTDTPRADHSALDEMAIEYAIQGHHWQPAHSLEHSTEIALPEFPEHLIAYADDYGEQAA